ncbi:hypothetical protein N8823_02640 [Candidatus Pseudothioglobus singularis]|nr:hypothetical protein [Candidatus Pseudothioglobus singularis]
MKKLLLIISLSFGLIGLSNSNELIYECTVDSLYEQTDSGEIKLSADTWQKIFKGQTFIVSKKTGLISGDFDTSELSDSRVFKEGTSGSSFKAMYFSQDAGRWLILEIQASSKGEEQPFKIIYLMGIVTGLCK